MNIQSIFQVKSINKTEELTVEGCGQETVKAIVKAYPGSNIMDDETSIIHVGFNINGKFCEPNKPHYLVGFNHKNFGNKTN